MAIFQSLEEAAKNMNFKNSREALDWYRKEALKMDKVDAEEVMKQTQPFRVFQNLDTPDRKSTRLNSSH